jgi:hypothetical protein
MKKKKHSAKDIDVILRKIASLEKISISNTLDNYKHYFGKYSIEVSERDMIDFKKRSIKSIRKPFSMENK